LPPDVRKVFDLPTSAPILAGYARSFKSLWGRVSLVKMERSPKGGVNFRKVIDLPHIGWQSHKRL